MSYGMMLSGPKLSHDALAGGAGGRASLGECHEALAKERRNILKTLGHTQHALKSFGEKLHSSGFDFLHPQYREVRMVLDLAAHANRSSIRSLASGVCSQIARSQAALANVAALHVSSHEGEIFPPQFREMVAVIARERVNLRYQPIPGSAMEGILECFGRVEQAVRESATAPGPGLYGAYKELLQKTAASFEALRDHLSTPTGNHWEFFGHHMIPTACFLAVTEAGTFLTKHFRRAEEIDFTPEYLARRATEIAAKKAAEPERVTKGSLAKSSEGNLSGSAATSSPATPLPLHDSAEILRQAREQALAARRDEAQMVADGLANDLKISLPVDQILKLGVTIEAYDRNLGVLRSYIGDEERVRGVVSAVPSVLAFDQRVIHEYTGKLNSCLLQIDQLNLGARSELSPGTAPSEFSSVAGLKRIEARIEWERICIELKEDRLDAQWAGSLCKVFLLHGAQCGKRMMDAVVVAGRDPAIQALLGDSRNEGERNQIITGHISTLIGLNALLPEKSGLVVNTVEHAARAEGNLPPALTRAIDWLANHRELWKPKSEPAIRQELSAA